MNGLDCSASEAIGYHRRIEHGLRTPCRKEICGASFCLLLFIKDRVGNDVDDRILAIRRFENLARHLYGLTHMLL